MPNNPFYRTGKRQVYIPSRSGQLDAGTWIDEPDPFGRLLEETDEDHLDVSNPFSLSASVGRRGGNGREDVGKIEVLMKLAGVMDLEPTDGPTGYYGTHLEEAVKSFQKTNGLKVDGAVSPEGETIRALAQNLQDMGRHGDTVLAHLTPGEAEFLHDITDGGSINPQTGLMEFFHGPRGGRGPGRGGPRGGNDSGGGDKDRDLSPPTGPTHNPPSSGRAFRMKGTMVAPAEKSGGEAKPASPDYDDAILRQQRIRNHIANQRLRDKQDKQNEPNKPPTNANEIIEEKLDKGKKQLLGPQQKQTEAEKPPSLPRTQKDVKNIQKIRDTFDRRSRGRFVSGGKQTSNNNDGGEVSQYNGKKTYKTKGPINIKHQTTTLTLDGLHYYAKWHALDENGKRKSYVEMPNNKGQQMTSAATQFTPNNQTLSPPFNNPHGWEIDISIPPQPTFNGNTGTSWVDVKVTR